MVLGWSVVLEALQILCSDKLMARLQNFAHQGVPNGMILCCAATAMSAMMYVCQSPAQ